MKVFKKMLVMMACFTALTSCGSSSENNTDNVESGNTIRMQMWNPNQVAVMKEIAEKYKEKTGVTVQIEETTFKEHFTKLETQAQGDVMPDVFIMNGPNLIKYASNGIIEPVEDHLKDLDINKENYPKALQDLYTYDGKLYTIPKDVDVTALFYNKELFDEAGVEYPTSEWTWDDYVKAAEKLTNKEKGIWGTCAIPTNQEGFYNTIHQNGGYVISEDKTKSGYGEPEAIESIKNWVDLIKKGYSPDLATMVDTGTKDLFKAGKVAMVYAGSWRIPEFSEDENIKDKYDIQVLPKIKERLTVMHGLSYAISKNSKNMDEAIKFVKFLASDEVNNIWAEKGTVIPANLNVLETWKKSHIDKNLGAVADQLNYDTVPYPVSADTAVWNQYETDMVNDVFSLNKSVEEGMKELDKKMEEALANEKH